MRTGKFRTALSHALFFYIAMLAGNAAPAFADDPPDVRPEPLYADGNRDLYGASSGGVVSEVRLGALAHDVKAFGGKEAGADINGEVLFVSPFPVNWGDNWPKYLQWIVHPRPHVGVDINTAGTTSQLYGGLTWTAVLATEIFRPDDGLEFNYFFGGAFNNGKTFTSEPGRKSLGSNLLFHLGFEVAYRFAPNWSISFIYEHSSNADLAHKNQGITSLGGRIGYHF